jgi:tRNA A-37 threonylcarbamoyl transferase component Bud32
VSTGVAPPLTEVFASVPSIAGFSNLTIVGHGSTATVYRALQDGFDREVAIKVLHLDISDRRAQKRFQRERSLNGRLSNHPNVVTVLDSGFVDGRYPYLAMEYLEEGSLADRLKQRGPFELALALHVGVRIAGALETAHRVGVLHRDVKPNNILLSRFEEPALADFGIAAILEMEQSLTAALTPVHAAPELLEGSEPTPQTDVYALGSTLYTLLAGAAPFAGPAGEGMLAQLLRITTSEVPTLARNDVPPELLALLRQSMAKRPDARIASAAEFGQQLQALQQKFGLPVSVLPVDVVAKIAAQVPAAPEDQTLTVESNEVIAPSEPIAPAAALAAVAAVAPVIPEAPTMSRAAEAGSSGEQVSPKGQDHVEADVPQTPQAADGTVTFERNPSFTNQTPSAASAVAVPSAAEPNAAEPTAAVSIATETIATDSQLSVGAAVADARVPALLADQHELDSFDPSVTISARQLHPPQPPTPSAKRPKWAIPLLVASAVGAATAVTVMVLANDSEPKKIQTTTNTVTFDQPVSTSPSPTTIDFVGGIDCARNNLKQCVPTNVAVVAQDGVLTVRFTDQTGGQLQHLVKFGREPNKVALDPVVTQAGESYLVLPEALSPTEQLCVVVAAVVDLPDQIAEAAATCINGGRIG